MKLRNTHISHAVLALAAAYALAPLAMTTAHAQTAADANAPAGKKPKVESARNGVTVVHIAPANSSGISHNLFTQFNVGAPGLVLNNSAAAPGAAPAPSPAPSPAPAPAPAPAPSPAPNPYPLPCHGCNYNGMPPPPSPDGASLMSGERPVLAGRAGGEALNSAQVVTTTSSLAGAIGGNFLFGGNSNARARLIVGEVNSAASSSLNGLIEVFGQTADVVIANPNGITCSGCGFINTSRASLVTGRPTWAGAALDGFAVNSGALNVGAGGLNGSTLSSLDLIGGSLRMDGQITLPAANSAIYAVLGANQVNYANLAAIAQARSGARPSLSLDLGAAAGMYANQIYLLANEQGPGVNVSGRVLAGSGGLTLDAAGNLNFAGTLRTSAAGSATVVTAAGVNASGGSIDSAGLALVQSSGPLKWTAGAIKASDVMLASAGNLETGSLPLQATGDVRLNSSGELSLEAGSIKAGGNVSLSAAGDLSLRPTKITNSSTSGSTRTDLTRYTRTDIDAAGSVALQSTAGVVTLDGTQVKSGASIAVQGLGVALLARKDLTKTTTVSGATTTAPSTENLVQARLLAEGDIALLASGGSDATGTEQGKLLITGAKIEANNGHVSLLAARDLDVAHDITTDTNHERFYEVKRGWFSKRVTDIIKTSVDETANPSDISGRSVSIGAGGNLNIVGSLVMADGAVGLHADQDLNLLATSESSYAYESRSVSKSGIFGNGGLSITIGSKNSSNITSTQETRQASTSVGSLGGDVLGTASGQYLQLSSDITAPQGDVNIAAQNITLQSNNNTRSVLNIVRERQSGFTLAASNPLVNAAQTATEMAKVAKRTENGRYQAMALLTSGLTIYNQYHDLSESSKGLTKATADAATSGWSFSVSLGASQSNYQSLTTSTTPIESSINAGRNVSLIATGGTDRGDINLIGSRVIASENLTLKADRDIMLTAAVGTDTEKTKRTSSAASIGISVGFGSNGAGTNLNLAASRSNAWSNGWGTTFWNSELTAGKVLSVDSGRDWALSGAKATGETVTARVGGKGAGNLTMVSPQDESFYLAKEQGYGINVSIPIYGSGSAPAGFGLSASGLKLLAENESVKQQSSIVAGTGGYDVRVNGHTHLKGSAMASKADAWRNTFETQTLTHEDVVNRDVASGKGWSVSLNFSNAPAGGIGAAGSSVGFARLDTNETFTTKSSVASVVNITRPDLQAGKVAAMKAAERDPLVAARDQKQNQLYILLSQEPPQCNSCQLNGMSPAPDAPPGTTVLDKGDASGASHSGTHSSLAQTEQVTPATNLADGSNSQWLAWQAAVQALQRDISGLNTRIGAVDAKVFQTSATLSNSPNGLHQPLLHTFDKAKATQELRDGVAVTAAFGKAAYKFAGDKAGQFERQAKAGCDNGIASACEDFKRWGEGGVYRGALHAAIGGMAFGTAGAVGNAAGTAITAAMPKALDGLGIADPTARNMLTNVAATLAGAAAGSTAGAAAAFNADVNNRQLHPNEMERLKRLANGDPLQEQKLSAAACYLVHCSAEFPAGSEAQIGLQALERVGATFSQEIALLKQQSDVRGQMFTHGYWNVAVDGVKRINGQYGVLAKLGGSLQVVGGGASAVAGSTIAGVGLASCAPSAGAGCLAAAGGGLLVLWGLDQVLAGSLTVASGMPRYTLGAHLISEVTGISIGAAELWYSIPGFATGTSAALSTTQETQKFAFQWRQSAATYFENFSPKGVILTDDIRNSSTFQAMVREINSSGVPLTDAIKYASTNFQSGVAAPIVRNAEASEVLFKIVPKGDGVNAASGFWMVADQAKAVSKMTTEKAADFLGLPQASLLAAQQRGGFDFYSIAARPGQAPIVFESTVASTVERSFLQMGGAKQTIVPNRSLWTDAVKVGPAAPSTFVPRRGG